MGLDFVFDIHAPLGSDCRDSRRPRLAAASAPAFAAPQCPTRDEMASLVGELFHEGSLSWEQLWSLACLPDLAPKLAAVLGTATDLRKPMAAE